MRDSAALGDLSTAPVPGDIPGSILDLLVNDPTLPGAWEVDFDLDGDGAEQVIGDGVSIRECVDGDGITRIPGSLCPCHPSIADGVSIAFGLGGVTARASAVAR